MAGFITVRTGQHVIVPGIYQGNCGNNPQRTLPKGHLAPPCQCCTRAVTWRLVQATQTNP
jgi:hypothetical protein